MYASLTKSDSFSINKVLSQTFITLSVMLGLTAITSFFSTNLHLGMGAFLGLTLLGFALIFGISFVRNSALALVGLVAFSVIEGITLGPVIGHYLQMKNGAFIVGTSALLTAVATGACSIYAIVSKKSFSRFGGFLLAGTIVLLVAMIINLFVESSAMALMISTVGALLFTAWILFDVSEIVTGQQTNYVMGALAIYLDIINLFLHLLRLVGAASSDD